MPNTHFAIGTHVLVGLALHRGRAVSSTELTDTVVTNPSFLRVVLGQLRRAGLIECQAGRNGGATLARSSAEITLLDVLCASEAEIGFTVHDCSQTKCALAQRIPGLLEEVHGRVDTVVSKELDQISIADLVTRAFPDGPPKRAPSKARVLPRSH